MLLSKCNLLINFYGSSTVLEASILDKPSITIDFPNFTQDYYQEYDPSLRISFREEETLKIKEAIEGMLENPYLHKEKRERLVKEWCFSVDGRAHERATDLIESLNK